MLLSILLYCFSCPRFVVCVLLSSLPPNLVSLIQLFSHTLLQSFKAAGHALLLLGMTRMTKTLMFLPMFTPCFGNCVVPKKSRNKSKEELLKKLMPEPNIYRACIFIYTYICIEACD